MDIRKLTDEVSVAPQIAVEDIAALAAAGFKTLMCNRPSNEELGQPETDAIVTEAKALGLNWVHLPVVGGQMDMSHVEGFRAALSEQAMPMLAYCRSGTRSSTLWALAEAPTRDTDEIIDACAAAGYNYEGMRGSLDSMKA